MRKFNKAKTKILPQHMIHIVKYGQIPKMTTALMEFSKELVPNKNKLTNK